jgi:hypothetical protein
MKSSPEDTIVQNVLDVSSFFSDTEFADELGEILSIVTQKPRRREDNNDFSEL